MKMKNIAAVAMAGCMAASLLPAAALQAPQPPPRAPLHPPKLPPAKHRGYRRRYRFSLSSST